MHDQGTIFIVDDSKVYLKLLGGILEKGGFSLLSFQSSQEAMNMLHEGKTDFDLAILDIVMPEYTGFDIAKQMSSMPSLRDVPIIFLTGQKGQKTDQLMGYAHGAIDYLLKPYDTEILLGKVRGLLTISRKFKSVKAREEQLDDILKTIGEGIIVVTQAFDVTYLNREFTNLFGFTKDELSGGGLSKMIPTKYRSSQLAQIGRILAKRQSKVLGKWMELTAVNKAGTEIPIELRIERSTNSQGEGLLTASVRDISDRKKRATLLEKSQEETSTALRQLEFKEKQLSTILNGISLGITLIDKDFKVVMANRFQGEIIKRPLQTFIGKNCFQEFEKRESVCSHCPGQKAMNTGIPHDVETKGILDNGKEVNVLIKAFPISHNDENFGFIEVVEDITERKRIENELKAKRSDLEALNKNLEQKVESETDKRLAQEKLLFHQSKMAAMGEMIGAIAHQWRQPLNTLALEIQEFRDLYDYEELTKESIEEIVSNCMQRIQFMSNTIDDFRNFFKATKEKSPFVLDDVIRESMKLTEAQLKNNFIQLIYNKKTGFEETIISYKNEFKQVLLNIISNARDAILARKQEDGQPLEYIGTIKLTSWDEKAQFVLEIEDDGGGIPKECFDRIFDPYFSTKQELNGTGIGLYMSQVIIQQHMQGVLTARNGEKGAVFSIVIPKAN